jgi:TIR domain
MATLTYVTEAGSSGHGNSNGGETEGLWEQLLQFIEEGHVIPVVGQELLTTSVGGRSIGLYSYLAEQLCERLGKRLGPRPVEGALTLNEVACRYLAKGGELEDLYSTLKTIMPRPDALQIPAQLLQLAEMPFKLFVSVTFDTLLERAINQAHFGGRDRAQVFAYSPQAVTDLPGTGEPLDKAVFHLFGRLSAVPDYAVTDEDVLEFVHSLQSETRRPNVLFDALNRSHVLIIGSTFSGWLARFFFRIAKRERLSMARGKTDFVADRSVGEDAGLVYFLNHFRTRTKVFPGDAVGFVSELHRRWTKRQPALPKSVDVVLPPPAEMPADAVFLSYASEDRAAAEVIKKELERAGIDVWFDRDDLVAGDNFSEKIKRNIESCSLFMPVISRHTLTLRKRFFFQEWRHAEKVAMRVSPRTRFIVPVAIDREASPDELGFFRDLHWTRLPDGQPTPGFVAEMRQFYRDYHRATASAA